MKAYIRLLSYENACAVIDYINKNDKEDYANIVSGGIQINVSDQNWEKVEEFIKSLDMPYELTKEHPAEVNKFIVESYKLGLKANDKVTLWNGDSGIVTGISFPYFIMKFPNGRKSEYHRMNIKEINSSLIEEAGTLEF